MKKKIISIILIISLIVLNGGNTTILEHKNVKAIDQASLKQAAIASDQYTFINLSVTKEKTTYFVGDTLTTNDIVVHGVFRNKNTASLKYVEMEYYINYYEAIDMSRPGSKTISILCWNYDWSDSFYAATVEITVLEKNTTTPDVTLPPVVTAPPAVTPSPTVTPKPTERPSVSDTPTDNGREIDKISCTTKYKNVKTNGKLKAAVKITWTQNDDAYKYEVYRTEGSSRGTYKKIASCGVSDSKYIDKLVVRGKVYYYKVRAIGGTAENSYKGNLSAWSGVVVPYNMVTPVFSYKYFNHAKNNFKLTFSKVEGENYELQYRFLKAKKWSKGKSGTLSSNKLTMTLNAKQTIQIRVRTCMKVNGEKRYSNWSAIKTVKRN